jgi:signal peptidase I
MNLRQLPSVSRGASIKRFKSSKVRRTRYPNSMLQKTKQQSVERKKKALAMKKAKLQRLRRRRLIKEISTAILGGCVLALGLSSLFINLLTVHGYSMVPTLREGDKVLLKKTRELDRFDLAVFTIGNNASQIRRVIGLPGETISYKEDTLFINSQPVDEKFIIDAINESQKNGRNYTEDFEQQSFLIPEGYYFVLGDNRPYATDSRHYGLIAKERVIGKAVIQLFPFNEIKAL